MKHLNFVMKILNSDFDEIFKFSELKKIGLPFIVITKIPATKIDFKHTFFQA
ncbi:hypothetical protein D3C80_2109170 [compost metagenome]